MKNSSDTIGNQTRDLPACRTVSQPIAPPAACPWLIRVYKRRSVTYKLRYFYKSNDYMIRPLFVREKFIILTVKQLRWTAVSILLTYIVHNKGQLLTIIVYFNFIVETSHNDIQKQNRTVAHPQYSIDCSSIEHLS
jgi:hypothetical protein